MKLLDVNVWLALVLSKHRHHQETRRWLDTEDRPATLCFCRATQIAFLRLTTAAVFSPYGNPPLTSRKAWSIYSQLAEDERVAFAREPAGIEAIWKSLAAGDAPSPKLWMDAYLSAFAITGKMRLVTLDHGFKNFEAKGLNLQLLTLSTK